MGGILPSTYSTVESANAQVIFVASQQPLRSNSVTLSGMIFSLTNLTDLKSLKSLEQAIDAGKRSVLIVHDESVGTHL